MQGVSMGLSQNASIASGSAVAISWTKTYFASTGYWVSSAPTRFTAPADPEGARMHSILARVLWESSSTGNKRVLMIRKNGNVILGSDSVIPGPSVGQTYDPMELEVQAMLSPTDYVELIVLQDTGSALFVSPDAMLNPTDFTLLSYR